MPNTQYGHPLFIQDLKVGSSAKKLTRIHFSKNASETTSYDEAWLQRLIMHQPSLLPVDQIEPAFANLIPVCIELPTPSGYLDNLLITPLGDLALVECKLWRNPEARREVVGQVIDYAKDLSAWSYEKLQDAISRTKPFGEKDEKPILSLYERAVGRSESDEPSFIDSVSRNLRRGRFLLLIIGDGIREGVESITEFLQQYAGLHFTLAIVELALFELPTGGYIAQPRVLARTTNIDRGIVRVDGEGRVSIGPANTTATQPSTPGSRMTITKERYIEKLEARFPDISQRLNRFIDKLEHYDVLPEFGTDSMILRWRPDDTTSWNLGQISTGGGVFTDHFSHQANSAGLLDAAKRYLAAIASLTPGGYVKQGRTGTSWYAAYTDGRGITVDALLADEAHENGWLQAIAEFQRSAAKTFNSN
jgi:hypothetical protein